MADQESKTDDRKERKESHRFIPSLTADKEFVWSLWKQLQSESPDLTAAVDVAISREKKKYEAQIEKVVHMVQKKDREIASLKQIIRCQDEKLLEAEVQETKMVADTNQRNDIVKELEERLSVLTVIVSEAEQQRIANVESQQSWAVEVKELKQKLIQMEKEREIAQKIYEDQENELKLQKSSHEEVNQNLSKLSAECGEHVRMCGEFKEQLQLKEKEIEVMQQSVDHKDMQINELSEQLNKAQQEIKTSESQLNMMQSELEDQRNEVTKHQQQVLFYQQQASFNQQQVWQMALVIQQKCSQLEAYAESHKQLQVAREEIEKLKAEIVEKDQQLLQLSKLSEATQSTCQERTNSLQSVVQELTSLHDVLTNERAEHELVVKGLKEELLTTNNRMLRELELTRQHLSPSTESTVSPTGPHIAVAPSQESARLTELLVMTEKELFNTKSLLEAKDNELVVTRKGHSQRLARMKSLQTEYKLVVEQLKTYETEKSPQQKPRNIGRSTAHSKGKSPQSGEALWSQLTSYKGQVESLSKKLSQVEEEKDRIQVKLAREQTTTAELHANFEAERNELTQKLTSLTSKTTTVTEEERKKTKEMEGIIKSLQQEKTSTFNAHKLLEKKYYELQEEMARTKSALLLAEKKAKESTTSPVSTVERCNNAVQTDYPCYSSPRNRHEQFNATWRSTIPHCMLSYKSNYHSRSLSDTFLQCRNFQDYESSILSQLSSSSSSSLIGAATEVQWHKKPTGVSTIVDVGRNDKEMEKSAPVMMVDTAVQCSCEEQQFLTAKRNLINQQIISKFQRESKSLKHRLATLSKQVEVLNSSKQSLTRALQQQKEQCETLRTEAASNNDKFQQCKAKVQSLSDDVTRLTEENSALQQRYNLLENIKVKAAASSVADKSVSGHSEAEWKSLEQRMKSLLEKYSAQNSTIQELQKQLHDKTMDYNQIQERLQHCERDVRQKRSFIENLRSRLRTEKYSQAEWEDTKTNLQGEISVLTERSVQHKQQIDYLKKQLSREQHEKEHLRVMNNKCAEELELTLQKLDHYRIELRQRETTCATENSKLQKATQELQELHAAHQLQMARIHSQLKQKDLTVNELHSFTKELALEIAAVVKSRLKQKQTTEDSNDEMLASRARKIAFSTLNLSATEFEQFVTETETEKQSSDEKLVQQINALLNSKPPFSTKLVKLFMRMMENNEV